jgi:hypothetical protein
MRRQGGSAEGKPENGMTDEPAADILATGTSCVMQLRSEAKRIAECAESLDTDIKDLMDEIDFGSESYRLKEVSMALFDAGILLSGARTAFYQTRIELSYVRLALDNALIELSDAKIRALEDAKIRALEDA